MLHISRTPFLKSSSEWLLLYVRLRGICNPAIDLKRTILELLSNLATERTPWKYCERKKQFCDTFFANLLCCTFYRIQKFLLTIISAPTGSSGTIFNSSVLHGQWYIQFVLRLKKMPHLSLLHIRLIRSNCFRKLKSKVGEV